MTRVIVILALMIGLCGVSTSARAQDPPRIVFSVSPFFCCGTPLTMEMTNSGTLPFVTSWWRFKPDDYSGIAYDPTLCNKDPLPNELGIVRVHGTQVSYDDPKNPGKVCVYDGTDLLAGIIPGMYDVAISQVGWSSSNVQGPYYTARHRSYPFPMGFTPTAPVPPDHEGITTLAGGNDWYKTVGLGPFIAMWSYDPALTGVTFNLYVDRILVNPQPIPDQSLQFTVPTYGIHRVEVTAVIKGVESFRTELNAMQFENTSGVVTPPLPPSPPTVTDPTCVTNPLVVVVSSYTTPLAPGEEGTVVGKVIAPDPVIQIQVKLNDQVIGEIAGTELRFIRAIGFGTPRIPGTYNLFVTTTDARGCHATTTVARPLVVR